MVGVGGEAWLAEMEMVIFFLLNWPPAYPVVVVKAYTQRAQNERDRVQRAL